MNPPPPGPPWDWPLAEAPLAFVDLEMTGLDAVHDRVVEVCIERVVGGERQALISTLVDPGERMGGAAHVHGLDAAKLTGAPRFDAVAADVLRALDGAILVAHAAVWDVRFLLAELKRAGVETSIEYWLDTLVLSRRALSSFTRTRSTRFAVSSRSTAARLIAPRVTFALCARCSTAASPRWPPRRVHAIGVEVRVGERRARQAIVDACEAAVKHRAPVVVTYRAARRPRSCSRWSCSRSARTSTRRALWAISSPGVAEDNCGPTVFCASNPRLHRPNRENSSMRRISLALSALVAAPLACGPSVGPQSANRTPVASEWLGRAKTCYRAADFDDAREAARHALSVAPTDVEIRELSARVALVRLDFAEALRLTEGLDSTDAHSIRGRSYWFTGDLEHAADELEAMLTDPKVKDPWAREVAQLSRQGAGRHPFEMDGGLIAEVDMPRQLDRVSLGAANVVPCELDGERILALVATGSSEVLLDSNTRHQPSWVNLRFDRIEVKDVPALVQDLTLVSRQIGVPIKALIGAQLLRHAHATFDRRGDQFVLRRQDAPPPPDASRVPLYYVRGGGMLLRATVTQRDDQAVPLLVDSSRPFPLLLEDSAWAKAGVDVRTLTPMADAPNVKRGMVPIFRVGGFDLSKMPAIQGEDFGELARGLDIDLAGVVGADLLAFFRVTFADDGRFMWIEPDPMLLGPAAPGPSRPPPPTEKPGPALPPAASTP